MKNTLLFILAIFLCAQVYAQTDSARLVQANWSVKKLNDNVLLKTARFINHDLFEANESINMLIITPDAKSVRLVVGYSDSLETTSQQAIRNQAIAGVNGSFFRMRGADPDNDPKLNKVPKLEPSKLPYNRSVTYLRKDGQLVAPNKIDKNQTERSRPQQGAVLLSDSGMTILKADSLNFNWESQITSRDIMTSGPMLLINMQNLPITADSFSKSRHPRTAVGKLADGSIMLIVVDGRTEESAGMSLAELQHTMRWLGCVNALNLDGGGSSAMYVKGEPENGIVSYPSDNKKFDHQGEREVANTILVIPVP